jgi:hypothetical protein
VRFAATHREYILKRLGEIPREISAKEAEAASATGERRDRVKKEISELEKTLGFSPSGPSFLGSDSNRFRIGPSGCTIGPSRSTRGIPTSES